MKSKTLATSFRVILILNAVLVSAPASFAQYQGGPYTITDSTIDSGGGVSSGGQFVLTGTIGQFDASSQPSAGGVFELNGGFWAKDVTVPVGEVIFSNGFED